MKIAVLGATGPSGQQVVKEGLERGHHVAAFVRNPEKITERHDNLTVAKVDIYKDETMTEHFKGQDVVISCLGCAAGLFNRREITFYTDTVKPIVQALKGAGVTRFVFMSSWYSKYNRSDPFIINWVFKPLMLGRILQNMSEMEDYLTTNEEGIDFTAVRCPQLTNSKSSGKRVLVTEGQVAEGAGYAICRRDAAKFMIDIAASGEYKTHVCCHRRRLTMFHANKISELCDQAGSTLCFV